jgi:hypothetical protein
VDYSQAQDETPHLAALMRLESNEQKRVSTKSPDEAGFQKNSLEKVLSVAKHTSCLATIFESSIWHLKPTGRFLGKSTQCMAQL